MYQDGPKDQSLAAIPLINGLYRCQNCRRDVDQVFKERRFRLCVECYEKIVISTAPGKSSDLSEAEYEARSEYWGWYREMERLYPLARSWKRSKPLLSLARLDDFWPFCECGQPRKEYAISSEVSLFGKIRAHYCPVCETKRMVESVVGMADAIHPDWDDEEWLDFLLKAYPEAFALKVLPDYWFELRMIYGQKTANGQSR